MLLNETGFLISNFTFVGLNGEAGSQGSPGVKGNSGPQGVPGPPGPSSVRDSKQPPATTGTLYVPVMITGRMPKVVCHHLRRHAYGEYEGLDYLLSILSQKKKGCFNEFKDGPLWLKFISRAFKGCTTSSFVHESFKIHSV